MKKALACLVAVAAFVLPTTGATAHHKPNNYCSPSGDVCLSSQREQGERKLRISLAAKYFSHYLLCVKAPDGSKVCKHFAIETHDGGYGDVVNWAAKFPPSGPGAYNATWKNNGTKLGPTLGFHVH